MACTVTINEQANSVHEFLALQLFKTTDFLQTASRMHSKMSSYTAVNFWPQAVFFAQWFQHKLQYLLYSSAHYNS